MTGTVHGGYQKLIIILLFVAAAGMLAVPAGASVTTHGRNMNLGQVDDLKNTVGSLNWGGYAAATSFSSPTAEVSTVNASWIVQAVSKSSTATYSAQWTGIGGYFSTDDSLIQLGTESDYYQDAAHYYAWIEMLPASEQVVSSLTIHPGDRIDARILPGSAANTWVLTLADVTTGKSYSATETYTSSKLSGEYVEERPEICSPFSCSLTSLADFGVSDYGLDYTSQAGTNYLTVNGANEKLGSEPFQNIIMYANNGKTEIAVPSSLSADGTSFTMTYESGTTLTRNGVPQFGPDRWGYNGNSATPQGAPGPLDHRMH
jgi:hypothetical protein